MVPNSTELPLCASTTCGRYSPCSTTRLIGSVDAGIVRLPETNQTAVWLMPCVVESIRKRGVGGLGSVPSQRITPWMIPLSLFLMTSGFSFRVGIFVSGGSLFVGGGVDFFTA